MARTLAPTPARGGSSSSSRWAVTRFRLLQRVPALMSDLSSSAQASSTAALGAAPASTTSSLRRLRRAGLKASPSSHGAIASPKSSTTDCHAAPTSSATPSALRSGFTPTIVASPAYRTRGGIHGDRRSVASGPAHCGIAPTPSPSTNRSCASSSTERRAVRSSRFWFIECIASRCELWQRREPVARAPGSDSAVATKPHGASDAHL